MTFIFDTYSAWLFFGAFGCVLWIVLNDLSKDTPMLNDCPLHPHQDTCAHRRKRKE